jgi:two-component system sensor histidine kinase MtrB
MTGRTVPEALRWALTFWRRSIQARVVVSTVLLSAVVVTAVGWFLLRQVERGLVDHRLQTVLVEVGNENNQSEQLLTAVPGTDTDASQQSRDLYLGLYSSAVARGFDVVMVGPGQRGQALDDRGPRPPRSRPC